MASLASHFNIFKIKKVKKMTEKLYLSYSRIKQRDRDGMLAPENYCDVKDCKKKSTHQLYDHTTPRPAWAPIEFPQVVCKEHYKEWNQKLVEGKNKK